MRRRLATVLATIVLVLSVLGPAAGAAFVEEPARLAVSQPHYVDSEVTVTTSGEVNGSDANTTTDVPTYHTQGAVLTLAPRNFPAEDVTDFGVAEGPGELSRDSRLGVYRFEPSKTGTYELYWLVEETRTVDNETREVTVRYVARLRANVTDRTHMAAGKLEQTREDAASWRNLVSEIKSEDVVGPDANVQNALDGALAYLRVTNHPMSALTGRLSGLVLSLLITVPGLIITTFAVGMHYASRRSDVKENRERRQLDEERADLEDQLAAVEEHERRSALESLDWNDIFPDRTARAFRDAFGETVLDGWLRMSDALTPESLVRDRLRAMSDTHVAIDADEDLATDGGTGGVRFVLAPREDVDEDTATVELDEPTDELLDGLAWDDPELRAFDMREADLDLSDGEALDSPDLSELMDKYGDGVAEFEDRETYGKYLAEVLAALREHECTDRDGRPRGVRLALNMWLRALRHIGDREGVPLAAYQADHVEGLLAAYNPEEEVRETVNETLREGV